MSSEGLQSLSFSCEYGAREVLVTGNTGVFNLLKLEVRRL